MRAVNLLPKDESRGRQATPVPMLVGVPLALLATVTLGAAYLQAGSKIVDRKQTYLDLKAQDDRIPKIKPASAVEQGLASQRTPRIAALGAALTRRVAWDRLLREVSQVLPDDVWLSTLSMTSPNSAISLVPPVATAPGAPATGMIMTGSTYSQESVARLLARVQLVPDLTNVQLQQSVLSQISGQNVITFTILADVRMPGGTS
jgi:Tfp pilus assembly protein PilN